MDSQADIGRHSPSLLGGDILRHRRAAAGISNRLGSYCLGMSVRKPEIVEPREEGIAERIVRQEKMRLEKEVYNSVF